MTKRAWPAAPAVTMAALATLMAPRLATAQRRPPTTGCEACAPHTAQLGFLHRTEWHRSTPKASWTETVTVTEVVPASPAEKAGLERGDRIVKVNGLVATTQLFWSLRRTLAVGDTLHLTIRRGGEERTLTMIAAPPDACEDLSGDEPARSTDHPLARRSAP